MPNDYSRADPESCELLLKGAKIHLNEIVDPNDVIVASIKKKYLPPKRR